MRIKGVITITPPIQKKTGGLVEMKFDAKTERFGLTWLRVMNGFGGGGGREDWVCDVEGVSVSISDYNLNKADQFGLFKYGTFEDSVRGECERSIEYAEQSKLELLEKIRTLNQGIETLKAATKGTQPK